MTSWPTLLSRALKHFYLRRVEQMINISRPAITPLALAVPLFRFTLRVGGAGTMSLDVKLKLITKPGAL